MTGEEIQELLKQASLQAGASNMLEASTLAALETGVEVSCELHLGKV